MSDNASILHRKTLYCNPDKGWVTDTSGFKLAATPVFLYGDTVQIDWIFRNNSGSAVDLTGFTFKFGVGTFADGELASTTTFWNDETSPGSSSSQSGSSETSVSSLSSASSASSLTGTLTSASSATSDNSQSTETSESSADESESSSVSSENFIGRVSCKLSLRTGDMATFVGSTQEQDGYATLWAYAAGEFDQLLCQFAIKIRNVVGDPLRTFESSSVSSAST